MHYHPWGARPSTHTQRLGLCVGPLRVHRSGGEWCCAAVVTHMYTHTYTYTLTARAVYVVRYHALLEWTSRSQADQPSREIRVCRTKGG